MQMTKTEMVHAPCKGGGSFGGSVIAGQIHVTLRSVPDAREPLSAFLLPRNLRLLDHRFPSRELAPDVGAELFRCIAAGNRAVSFEALAHLG